MTEEKMEVLVAISTYLMFRSKRALIQLQIAAWHHRKKKGDGLRSRRGTTRKVEEHFPRHVQGLGWRKSSRNFVGKTVWRADGDKKSQKEVRAGLGWENQGGRDAGRRQARLEEEARRRKRPHAPSRAGV